MRSICMGTYNGAKYIREQLDSILPQLREDDELILSDDGSKDETLEIVRSYNDSRIKIFENENHGVARNFENALNHASGDIIYFADQDDVWLPGKLDKMEAFLLEGGYDVILCNCSLTDGSLNITKERHYNEKWPMKKSFLQNLVNNCWLGACMAFTKRVKEGCDPFPKNVVAHDLWISLFAQLHYKCGYLDEVLQLYRRHENTVSFTGGKSRNSLYFKISYRAYLAWHLFIRSLTFRAN